MNATIHQLDELASRASTIYSRPTVAMELVRLAEQPGVNAAALRDCVAQDPALTCKILRVVNSSRYGLSPRIGSIRHAATYLGRRTLRLTAVTFSLVEMNNHASANSVYASRNATRAAMRIDGVASGVCGPPGE